MPLNFFSQPLLGFGRGPLASGRGLAGMFGGGKFAQSLLGQVALPGSLGSFLRAPSSGVGPVRTALGNLQTFASMNPWQRAGGAPVAGIMPAGLPRSAVIPGSQAGDMTPISPVSRPPQFSYGGPAQFPFPGFRRWTPFAQPEAQAGGGPTINLSFGAPAPSVLGGTSLPSAALYNTFGISPSTMGYRNPFLSQFAPFRGQGFMDRLVSDYFQGPQRTPFGVRFQELA